MSKVLVEESNLTAIASAIRSKLGVQTTYKPSQMAAAIQSIAPQPSLETKSIVANGTYTPASGKDGFSEVTVNVPNSYAAGDEGKVVSSGALVAQTARASTITSNGTYDTTENNSVTVNVDGSVSQGPTFSTLQPNNSQGSNGDYWYVYNTKSNLFTDGIDRDRSSNTDIYGNEFTALREVVVTGLKGRCNEARTGNLRIGDGSNILATVSDVTFTAGDWIEVQLPTPITLTANTNYIVQLVTNESSGKIAYTKTKPYVSPSFTWVKTRYGGYPGNQETDNYVNVDIVVARDRFVIEQYIKKSGAWKQIYE